MLLSHCLLAGKAVTISSEASLAGHLKQSTGQANGYVKQLLKYKEQLIGFGVQFEAIEDFASRSEGSGKKTAQAVSTADGQAGKSPSGKMSAWTQEKYEGSSNGHASGEGKKKLLTQRDVQDSKSAEIIVCKSTIITPSARDAAKELGKSIIVAE